MKPLAPIGALLAVAALSLGARPAAGSGSPPPALSPLQAMAVDGSWALQPPPSDRLGNTAIYDSHHNRMIVFAGTDAIAGNLNDVWMLSLSGTPAWYPILPSGTPPPLRRAAAAIYDPVRDRMIVFGGRKSGTTMYGDVWALSLSGSPAWTQLAPSGSPPSARRAPSAIYDPTGDRMVVFGGNDGVSLQNDVWAMSLGTSPAWTQLAPAGTPPAPRFVHRAVYDPLRARMIVFGGQGAIADLNDVWSLTLSGTPTWSLLPTAGTPPSARDWPSTVYDPVRDRLVLFGGEDFTGVFNAETWALSLAGSLTWSLLAPAGPGPTARATAAVYDPVSDRMVLFGGLASSDQADTWALGLAGGTAWTQLGVSPPARFAAGAIYDPVRRRMLVFGGRYTADGVTFSPFNEVWAMSLGTSPAWSKIVPAGPPPPARGEVSAIYDPMRDRMIVFGGYDGVNTFADTWALTLSGTPTWTQLLPSGSPGNRDMCSAIYDPVRDRLIFFGGSDEISLFNSVWALSLGASPAWTQLFPTGTPPVVRLEHAAIYDPVRDRMVLFGGRGNGTEYGDCWALSLSGTPAWTQLLPTGAPPPARDSHTAIYDPLRDRVVIFAGGDGTTVLGDVWALSLGGTPAYTQLLPTGMGAWPRQVHNAIYDPVADRMVVYGGADPTSITVFADAWFLTFGTTLGVPEPATADAVTIASAFPNPAPRSGASIEFTLPRAGQASLCVYDVSGRVVARLFDGPMPSGSRVMKWDGRSSSGAPAEPGLYFFELRAGGRSLARRIAIVR